MLAYREALRKIFERANWERGDQLPYGDRVWRLDRVLELLSQFGDPHRKYRSVHIAGTKGKGSTTAMIDAILRAAGYRTGMYTSPHLHTFRERIRLDGEPIPEEQVTRLVEGMLPVLVERPEVTVFEIMTALAMLYYAQQEVDFGVFEVGLGGRLDATNVLAPMVSVLTSISMDHVSVLGDTIAAIAGEKAGIIKPGTPVVSAPQHPDARAVILDTCVERQAPLQIVGEDWQWRFLGADLRAQTVDIYRTGNDAEPEHPHLEVPLLGAHQLENACAAVAAIEVLRDNGVTVAPQAVRSGLADVNWPGRMEVLGRDPLVVVDGAHNPDSIRRLLSALASYLSYRKLIVVFGAGYTHRPSQLLALLLARANRLVVTQAVNPKATPSEELETIVRGLGGAAEPIGSVAEAVGRAISVAEKGDLVLVTGSLFVVAEAREAWAALHNLPLPPSDPPGVY